MTEPPIRVLFLCTGNSARSILAEALLNDRAEGRWQAYSAGSRPAGRVHPQALALLQARGIDTHGLRSKSWDEFEGAQAPALDLVVTVCDNAAGETCPIWFGQPLRLHWGLPDPAAVQGETAQREAFAATAAALERRFENLLALRREALHEPEVWRRLQAMGAATP